ncbi:MAG TPA: ATP-binding protein [Acidimicrobiales bacterium]|nr:ATP-binding protein [Acidimicrobiales bacterium]
MVSRSWTHWATSRDLVSLMVPSHDAGTGLAGRSLGDAQRGGAFVLDPFDAYATGVVSNPNVIVAGSIGAGKSTVVKMMLDRALERGRRAVIIDPKGEYAQLARSYGVTVVALGRDGWCSPFPSNDRESRDLLRALVASAQGAALKSDQHYVIDELWQRLESPRPRRVLRALFELVRAHLTSASGPERTLALTLYRFIHGDLAELFDGDDDPMVFEGQLVVLDLSAQWSSNSFSVAALSAVAAAQQVVAVEGELGYLVLDEAWSLLADPHALRWLQGSWKLARAKGLSHVLVLHRWSDVAAAGDVGSAHRERAQGLLRECETAWLFRQPPDEAREMAIALGLHRREERYLSALPKGTALVRYGAHRSIVRVRPDDRDREFIDTDGAMRIPLANE